MKIIRKVWKTGGNHVITIPKDCVEELGIEEGNRIEVKIVEGE